MPTLTPTPTPLPDPNAPGVWYVNYYNNPNFFGTPVYSQNVSSLFFYWGNASPAPNVPPDHFSAVFTLNQSFPQTANYMLSLVVDGAARVYFDDNLIIDQWFLGKERMAFANVPVSAGDHRLKVEYYDQKGDATLCLTWNIGYTAWVGDYYNTTNPPLQGPPAMIRNDDEIQFDWGQGSPDPRINADNFSVDWKRYVNFPTSGQYEFRVEVDDGARVFIDGQLMNDLNDWSPPSPKTMTQRKRLSAGKHFIEVQYIELTGDARIKFSWQLVTIVPTKVPVFLTPCPLPC